MRMLLMPGEHGICKSHHRFALKKIPHDSVLTYLGFQEEEQFMQTGSLRAPTEDGALSHK